MEVNKIVTINKDTFSDLCAKVYIDILTSYHKRGNSDIEEVTMITLMYNLFTKKLKRELFSKDFDFEKEEI